MGNSARDTKKTEQAIQIRPTEDLLARINKAWSGGPLKDIDRQQFFLVLLRIGVDEYLRREADSKSSDADDSNNKQSPEDETKHAAI